MPRKPIHIVTKRFIEFYHELSNRKAFKSQSEFSTRIGQSPANFGKVGRGQQDVSIEMIYASCIEYDLNPNYLFVESEDNMFLSAQKSIPQENLESLIARISDLEAEVKRIKKGGNI